MTSSSSLATTTNMAELTTSDVSSAIREIAATIERLDNPNDVELLKLRLDYVSRMLVTIDVPEEIVNTMSSGFLYSKGHRVQRERIRQSLLRTDPSGAAQRWKQAVKRRRYNVHSPLSLWHIDGNHKLIRYVLANKIL